jgi:glutamine synthetase
MEALCLKDMINQHVIPSCKKSNIGPVSELEGCVDKLKTALADLHATENIYEKAKKARILRLDTMMDIREVCDAAEEVVPASDWTLATYKDLLFLDTHTVSETMMPDILEE